MGFFIFWGSAFIPNYFTKSRYTWSTYGGMRMNENGNRNAHTNTMISRLQRELEETKDVKRKQEIEKEITNLRAGFAK